MTRPRTAGLDTLRALAIALVFTYHYAIFVSRTNTFGVFSVIGWSGVDLFFVLSGYLIASQLFAGLARGQALSVGRFYARRAFRTLPVFWLVLAAFLLWPDALGGRTPPPAWRFLTFTQNLGLQPGTAFSHAWSLCIEEQFYLVLPALLALGTLPGRGKDGAGAAPAGLGRWLGWALLAGLVLLAIGLRGHRWLAIDRAHGGAPAEFMTRIYYASACRFDELLPGVAVAMLRHFHPAAWSRAMARGRLWLALGLAGATAVLTLAYRESDQDTFGFAMTTFGYTVLAASFALLVMAALSPSTALHRWRVPGLRPLALWSYSIYLTHKPLAHVLQVALAPHGIDGYPLATIIIVACVACGAALHAIVEGPFMRLRDRLVPSNFLDPAELPEPAAVGAR